MISTSQHQNAYAFQRVLRDVTDGQPEHPKFGRPGVDFERWLGDL